MGVSVTVVEAADHIMPVEDAEISAMAEKLFFNRGSLSITAMRIRPRPPEMG